MRKPQFCFVAFFSNVENYFCAYPFGFVFRKLDTSRHGSITGHSRRCMLALFVPFRHHFRRVFKYPGFKIIIQHQPNQFFVRDQFG
jgi:hypothetical protein